jgi:hypothetical protein
MANPGSLADPNCAAFSNALPDDRHGDIFVRMIVVHNQYHLANKDIALQIDSVLGSDDTAEPYVTIVLQDDCWLAIRILRGDA